MKTLIVFYSRTGTTKKVAEELAKYLNADVEELIDTKKRKGVLNYMICGRDALKKTPAIIEKTIFDSSAYDLTMVGTPIWAGAITPAVRSYLVENKNKIKKIAIFCTRGGEGKPKIFEEIKNSFVLSPTSTMTLLTKEVVKNTHKEKLKDFIDSISE